MQVLGRPTASLLHILLVIMILIIIVTNGERQLSRCIHIIFRADHWIFLISVYSSAVVLALAGIRLIPRLLLLALPGRAFGNQIVILIVRYDRPLW